MAIVKNKGYVIVDSDPNGITELQSGDIATIAYYQNGTTVNIYKFNSSATAGSKWELLGGGATTSASTLASGNTAILEDGVQIAEVPFEYDSGWKTLPIYTSALGFGVPNFNLRPQIRVKNRTVYLQNNFVIPLDNSGTPVTTILNVTTTPSSLTHYSADTMSKSSSDTIFTSRPIVPSALYSDGLAIITMNELSQRAYTNGVRTTFTGFAGIVYTINGRLYFENLNKTEGQSSANPTPFANPIRKILSKVDSGDSLENHTNYHTSFDSSGVSKATLSPATFPTSVPFDVDGSNPDYQGGQQFRIGGWSWQLNPTVTLAQLQSAIAQF